MSRGVSACGFIAVGLWQGMTAWPPGCFPLTAAVSCEPGLRVKGRALGPGRLWRRRRRP